MQGTLCTSEKEICILNQYKTAYDVDKDTERKVNKLKKLFMKWFSENWVEVPYLQKVIEIVRDEK